MNEESLQSKLLADLEKTGFGSEMRALKTLLDRRWTATGSASFYDQDESKSREVDLQAHRALQTIQKGGRILFSDSTADTNSTLVEDWSEMLADFDRTVDVFFEIVGEVKKASAPWVVFKQPAIEEYQLGLGHRSLDFTCGIPDRSTRTADRIYQALSSGLAADLGWIGYGIHEAFKPPDKPSRWYSAMVTACKAAEHTLKGNSWDTSGKPPPDPYVYFVQPTVILDGLLYSAELDDSASIQLAEIEYAAVSFVFTSPNYRHGEYRVNVVRLDTLDKYIEMCEQQQKMIFDAVMSQGRQGRKGVRNRFVTSDR